MSGQVRKGSKPDSERDKFPDGGSKIRVVNFKCEEYVYAQIHSRLIEENRNLTDFFRICFRAYLANDMEFTKVINRYENTKKKEGKNVGTRPLAWYKKYEKVLEREKSVVDPPAPEEAKEFYDIIEKNEDD
jgi:hypothetical protein